MTKKIITKSKRIPHFKNRQEEAEFWDNHSTADYESEFKPVKASFAKNLSEGITIRFDDITLKKLRYQAQDKGIGPTTLIRMWVLERIKQETMTQSSKNR